MALTVPYQAFIDTPNKEVIILAEVTPKEHLISWNSVLGLTRTTAQAFNNFVVEDVVQGGVYRKLTSIIQGTQQLRKVFQPGFVEDQPDTWYYNESAKPVVNEIWPSGDLSAIEWVKVNTTVTVDDITGPDAITLADRLVETAAAADVHHVVQLTTPPQSIGDQHIVQAFVRADNRTLCIVGDRGDAAIHNVYVDLSTGTLLTENNLDDSRIEPYPDGWYKVSITYTTTTNNDPRPYVGIAISDGSDTYNGNTAFGIFTNGIQFMRNETNVRTPYVQTLDSAVTLNPYTIWMYPSLSGGDVSTMIVTNLCLWSEDYSNPVWDGTADAGDVPGILDPQGGVTGWTLSDTNASQTESKEQDFVPIDGEEYTYSSFIAKTSGATTFPGVVMTFSGGSSVGTQQTIDTNNGILYTRPGHAEPHSRSIVSWDNNWWRISINAHNNSTGNTNLRIGQFPAINSNPPDNWSNAIQGSIGWWGSQLQKFEGVSDYVKTEATSATKEIVEFTGTTSAAVVAKFRVHFGTTAKIFNDIYYEPRLTTRSLPGVQEHIEDVVTGAVKQVSSGDITLNNADSIFDILTADWVWKNAEVQLYLGGDDLNHISGGGLDYTEIGSYFVEDYALDLDELSLFVRDVQKFSLTELPITFVDSAAYPNAASSEGGDKIPILFGQKSNITPILIDTTEQNGEYLIADPNYQTLYAIDVVFDDGVEIVAGDLTKDLTACTFIINDSYGSTPGTVTCIATGQPARGTAWETSVDYLKFYGEIVGEIYTNYLNVPAANYDGAAAISVDAEEPVVQAAYISESKSVRTYIRRFEVGVVGRTVKTPAGVLTPTIWSTEQPLELREIIDPDVVDFQVDPKIESLFTSLVILGDKDPTTGSFSVVVTGSTNTTVKYVHLNGLDVIKDVETFLKNVSDANALANSMQRITSNPSLHVTIKETGISLMHFTIGDKLLVTFNRAPSELGEWSKQLVEVIAINRSLSPQPAVEIVINNLRGAVFGNWTSDSASIYISASSSERLSNGYWVDGIGRADSLDAESGGISRWQ